MIFYSVLHVHVAQSNDANGMAELVTVDGLNGHNHSDIQCVHVAMTDGTNSGEEKNLSELSPLEMCRSHSPCPE